MVSLTVTAEGRGACTDEGLEVDAKPTSEQVCRRWMLGCACLWSASWGYVCGTWDLQVGGGVLDSAVPSHPVCLRVYFRREAPPPSPSSTLASPEDRGLSVTWEVLLLLMMGRGSPLGAPAVTAVEDTQRRLHPALPWV